MSIGKLLEVGLYVLPKPLDVVYVHFNPPKPPSALTPLAGFWSLGPSPTANMLTSASSTKLHSGKLLRPPSDGLILLRKGSINEARKAAVGHPQSELLAAGKLEEVIKKEAKEADSEKLRAENRDTIVGAQTQDGEVKTVKVREDLTIKKGGKWQGGCFRKMRL